jgi:hypothetical protein
VKYTKGCPSFTTLKSEGIRTIPVKNIETVDTLTIYVFKGILEK